MKIGTYAVAALLAGSCLTLAAVASNTASRGRHDVASTTIGRGVGELIPGRSVEGPGSVIAGRYDEDFVKWIPVVVPLLAVLLAVGTYLILGMIA